MIRRAALLAALGATGCSKLEPDVGPVLAGGCEDRDSDPAAQVSFSRQIRPVIDRDEGGCSCHKPFSSGPGPGTRLGGLDLTSLASLREGGFGSGPDIVVNGQPCASILFQKISPAPPYGSRMPLGGPYLTAAEIQLIHDWIAEGAADN